MVDEQLALRRAAGLSSRIARLRAVLPPDRAAFLCDVDAQERVSFNLFLAIQALVDLAAMIAGDEGWPVPETMSAIFELLAGHAVLDRALAGRLSAAARMRILLVHRYGDVDHGIVHDVVREELPDLEAAVASILRFVKARGA